MRNRAKCRKCGETIESFHRYDYVYCKCREIGISGGSDEYHVAANDFAYFLRVDDEGNELVITVQDNVQIVQMAGLQESKKFDKRELLGMLDEMRLRFENLPAEALYSPTTHADFASLLLLLSAIFKAEE